MNKHRRSFRADDTGIGGAHDIFPATRWSAIVALRSDEAGERSRAIEAVVATYWKPVYKYLRIKWGKSNEDAKDLTQGFFAKAIEKEFFSGYDPQKARFRTFLRACLDGFVANENKAAGRLKRGGAAQILSLDFESAEGELQHAEIPAAQALDEYFEKEWIRSLFALTIERLDAECKSQGKEIHFRLFQKYDLDEGPENKPSYEQLAEEFELSISKVTNYLAFTRREFRRIVLEKVRELTASDEEFRDEARQLLGVEVE